MSTPQSSPVRFQSASGNGEAASAAETVRRAYRQVLKRNPDAVGLEHYRQLLEMAAIDVKTIVRDLLHSYEWKTKFVEGRTVPETVLALYDCVLSRAPDVDGWNQLTSWEPRNGWRTVIDGMLDGAEYEERFGCDLVPGEARGDELAHR